MLVPLSWLRDFAPFGEDAKALADTFDALGMVVEGITHVGSGLDKVVVGRVLEVAPIEKARVRRTRVDLGEVHGHDIQIVCGAPNVEAGQLVPVAVVGAVLPGDFEIAQRTVRGVESNGMICSKVELAMGAESEGIWVLPEDLAPVGTPFVEAMGIQPDVVYDLAIEGNRPDANCMAGVARDAAAALGLGFTLPAVDVAALAALPQVEVRPDIANSAMCPRFTATVIEGVKVGPSPDWLANRLRLAGMRPISNLVDISNYVMLELGQPTHPYDMERIPGRSLGVRTAKVGERLTTLDDVERTLGKGDYPDCVITDGEDTAVGLAGLMGGASSEIHDETSKVYLEAAHFDRMTIARSSKRLSLRSEASARFEKGVDPFGIEMCVARFVQLAGELAGGTAVAYSDVTDVSTVPARRPITTRVERVNKVLGIPFTAERITELLTPIGFRADATADGQVLEVTPPSYRLDCDIEEDVIEEVARHHGYVNLPRTTPRSPFAGGLTPYQSERRKVRDVLCGLGLSEAVCSNLVGPGDHAKVGLSEDGVITAVDPMAKEESVLRRSLRPGLLRAVVYNLERRAESVRLFEIGHTFERALHGHHCDPRDADLPDEREMLSFVVAGEGADATVATQIWLGLADALGLDRVRLRRTADITGTHTTRTARILGPDGPVGAVGEIDPAVCDRLESGRVGFCEVDLRALLTKVPRREAAARPVSRFPSSDIDLAFAVPENVAAGTVLSTLTQAAGSLAEWVKLFDVYRGQGLPDGSRSLAFRLRFVAQDRTLTDAEVATARQKCIDAVVRSHHATLR